MSRSASFIRYFLSHRHVTKNLAARIGEDHLGYKPTPTSMPAGELVAHMLVSFKWFAEMAAAGHALPYPGNGGALTNNLSESAEEYTQQTISIIEGFKDEDYEREVDLSSSFGMKVPVKQLLQMAMDHEVNHKGNLFVYVREMGHTDLPMFIQLK